MSWNIYGGEIINNIKIRNIEIKEGIEREVKGYGAIWKHELLFLSFLFYMKRKSRGYFKVFYCSSVSNNIVQ